MQELNRKEFIKKTAIIGTLLASSEIIAEEESKMRDLQLINFSEALQELKKLETSKIKVVSGSWNLYQIINHCAQSIEYSMSGYPELKSVVFRKTVGKLAYSVFSFKNKMSHDTNAPVPGAPDLAKEGDIKIALQRLYKAIEDFQNFTGELKPHLAYDNLNKIEYEKARSMHIANHLSFIELEA
jgi:hypothetical protein